MNILLTGVAGFIGFHTAKYLLSKNHKIIGIDNLNDYYDTSLKKNRLNLLKKFKKFDFIKFNIQNKNLSSKIRNFKIDCVINLAAQAGVRYSLINPYSYIDSNISGQLNILEVIKKKKIKKLIYASSSSVYGGNKDYPFSIKQRVDNPISLYAASKKSCELLTECYSHLFRFSAIGLRFFTVYGPWGRPDMATYIFTKNILENKKIDIYNHGKMKRDFTYIDDIIKGIEGSINFIGNGEGYHKIYNLGNNQSENLLDFIGIIEKTLGRKAKKKFMNIQPGDVPETYADISESLKDLGFKPEVKITEGIPKFISWYKEYYKLL